ncbi:MFS transporter [Phenylobacterium sp. 20VBR1]|uniref:MFS transporter n=1 Tax=Phenylobacterium glaciei TaxID=2803784 RepID=A0A941D1N2_9CAUL|nr:MFS transporter [Phenylobacterium glaciei]MBR7619942.1 MFS transporter [Phenylobacterium glaciei]
MAPAERRSNWILAALAAPCLPLAGLGLPLVVYLPEFYASDLGLSLSVVGAAFGAVRLIDMAFDPFIGGVMDKTRSRFGRFKLWFAISAPILMLAAYMLFMAKPGVSGLYLWFWLLVVYGGFSIASLSQLAWGAVLSPHYDQRSRIYGWWQAGNVVGIILVLTLPALLPLVGIKGHGVGVAAMGWFVVLLMPLAVSLALWKVPEPTITTPPRRAGINEYVALLKRPSVVRLLAADFVIGTGPAITGALFFFYFERVKDFDKGVASLLLLIYFVGGLVGAPVWTWLAYRIGKHRALAFSSVVYAAMTMAILLVPPGNFAIAALLMFLIGVPYAAGAFLLRAMMADVGDEERLESGGDRMALLYALLSGTVKIGSAAAVFFTFPALELMGFDPKATGVATGLGGLSVIFTVVPAGLALIGAWIIITFPLTAELHAAIRDALHARDQAEEAHG